MKTNKPSKVVTRRLLVPCFWLRLLCEECGQCYVAVEKNVPTLPCPDCWHHRWTELVCVGMTTAEMPHYGPRMPLNLHAHLTARVEREAFA